MTLRVLDLDRDGAAWDAALQALPPELRDVYFGAAYHLVWQRNGDGAAGGAIFESADGVVLYPFLRRPLDAVPFLGTAWRSRSDITSAYGYGGPLAAVTGERPPGWPNEPGAATACESSPGAGDAAGGLPAPPSGGDGPVVTPARRRLLAAFRREFCAWCRHEGVVSEFVRFHPLLQTELGLGAVPAAGPAQDPVPVVEVVPANITVWRRLSTPAAHRAALSSSTRRNLRKADRAGLTFGIETSDEAWERFVELYIGTMTRRGAGAYYLFSQRYFDDCRELLGNAAALLTVRRPAGSGTLDAEAGPTASPGGGESGEIVAAAFFLRSALAIHYHLGGSDAAALAERPNNLLFVGAMDWGAEFGAEAMHLGGGFRAGGDDELFRFKAGFSSQRARFHMGRCTHDPDAYAEALAAWRAAGGEDPGGFFPAYRAPLPG